MQLSAAGRIDTDGDKAKADDDDIDSLKTMAKVSHKLPCGTAVRGKGAD